MKKLILALSAKLQMAMYLLKQAVIIAIIFNVVLYAIKMAGYKGASCCYPSVLVLSMVAYAVGSFIYILCKTEPVTSKNIQEQ